jgi:hypothetical protein
MASQIRLTVDFDNAASDPSASASAASTSRTDRPRTTDAGPEQPGGERLVGVPELRALEGDGARGGLDRDRGVAVPAAFSGTITAHVALPTQELGDLGFEGGLHQEADAQMGHFLEDLAELTVGGEQLVDIGADAFYGGYSFRHGCGFPFFAYRA